MLFYGLLSCRVMLSHSHSCAIPELEIKCRENENESIFIGKILYQKNKKMEVQRISLNSIKVQSVQSSNEPQLFTYINIIDLLNFFV